MTTEELDTLSNLLIKFEIEVFTNKDLTIGDVIVLLNERKKRKNGTDYL